jgi:hypothetical protein
VNSVWPSRQLVIVNASYNVVLLRLNVFFFAASAVWSRGKISYTDIPKLEV